ncbi:5-formyltetrahydrofolate cyclo-ligase [Rhodoferax sp.]|uniref:5-formyltetrahydrofolate cyclo-ligase n=1 Tax=Rhodoferax sp. TaxID=50421 RepID=UPI0027321190|nr:5-formyltetrahydrofolate cyclo-ligase [Rhodoferax sp.]MDP2443313.1 5-formyltetrahydrofolate cyclo-ligase [Rhodoferax sp.]
MLPSAVDFDKASLRRQLRERRKAVGAYFRRVAGSTLVRLALRHRLLAKGRRIGIYMPAKSEIDVLPLRDRALVMQAHCFLPIVPSRGRKKMWFSQLGKQSSWVLNRYGIPEYQHPLAKRVRVQNLDLLFIPLLGFDSLGFRLGMGGGYYDASLAHLNRVRSWRRPRVIGVAFSMQEVERLPSDPWDIPMDAVLTEREYRVFRSTRG